VRTTAWGFGVEEGRVSVPMNAGRVVCEGWVLRRGGLVEGHFGLRARLDDQRARRVGEDALARHSGKRIGRYNWGAWNFGE